MENETLRIRIVSFKNSNKQNLNKSLFYIKKLLELPSNKDDTIILEPTGPTTAFVISINETFDWNRNHGSYCQIICLTQKSKIIADTILWFDHLLELFADRRYDGKIEPELPCSMTLDGEYDLKFSLQLLENSRSSDPSLSNKYNHYNKISSRQPIRGHLMKLKQFNHPVHCALCDGFIWGLHHQGFECSQCSLVTHRRCHQNTPFWCQKSLFSEPSRLDENLRLKFHIPHTFKRYEAPFVRALVTRNHGYCNHCGAQIFRNALKCTQCHFIIHEHCQSSIPPMCTISYDTLAKIISEKKYHKPINMPRHDQNVAPGISKYSKSSSFDLSWLDSLPKLSIENQQTISLPKFIDFKYVGRLGDGAFAQVYCVQHILSKQYFAIKVADGKNEQARQQLEVEKQILFRHSSGNPYMVKAYCAFHQGYNLFLVMELVQGGTLYHKIQRKRMNEDEIKYYLAQLISVIQYLHSNKIVYRDLKLEHAIVCSTGSLRLVDYGLGRLLKTPDEHCHTFCGTYSYMAPEVRRLERDSSGEGYSYAVDFWALGIMLVQMLCGEQLDFYPYMFSNDNEQTSEPKDIKEYLELPRCISPEADSCVIGLLENDPEKRLGSPNSPHGLIRDHVFFKVGHQINWSEIDEGVFKSCHKNSRDIHVASDTSFHSALATLSLDRGGQAKDNWTAAGISTCTPEENERLKSFDYISESSWHEFT
ncbi:unnamed protein product [Rotaria sp. Silwood1]|nr:unnamed protein product [Rotaria sp. Silwood1]CAF3627426.1 unnamed protein product [Rotaria sp. Silwood1]CAF3639871.1 unnamed protein product [Rotaria sp. Silwood1]CAF4531396.1 unnamed protein product [Rotaria sp. Silwood1]CAF4674575.1 unnamed protein product [Rotaria sp. Silwood1]